MTERYDVIVIGSGLGGLTAAALLARAGCRTLLLERNSSVGGAASTYKSGDLVIEAALHETSDPRDPADPKHRILSRAGVLDTLEWIPTGSLYEVRGGAIGAPFILPDGFSAARHALNDRFPSARDNIAAMLADMERVTAAFGILGQDRQSGNVFKNTREKLAAYLKLAPLARGWRRSLGEELARAFGDNEAIKCALAANLIYYHDDPDALWWTFFAIAQGEFLASGSCFVRGGSQRLSNALARAIKRAGGEVRLRRTVNEIRLDADGRASGVVHVDRKGGDRTLAHAPVIIANAAPAVLTTMLPRSSRERFWSTFTDRKLSISLFSATFGLSVRPATLGFRSYSTMLLPAWMQKLSDYRLNAGLLADPPGERMPLMAVVDYSAIDSGLGGPPYPVSVAGVDRFAHWAALDKEAHDFRREQWRRAILAAIDREFPGFAAHVVASVFNTAHSMKIYLNAPDGAVYGFAPLVPARPIWHGGDCSIRTPIPGFYLASSYAGAGGFTGALMAASTAVDRILAES